MRKRLRSLKRQEYSASSSSAYNREETTAREGSGDRDVGLEDHGVNDDLRGGLGEGGCNLTKM